MNDQTLKTKIWLQLHPNETTINDIINMNHSWIMERLGQYGLLYDWNINIGVTYNSLTLIFLKCYTYYTAFIICRSVDCNSVIFILHVTSINLVYIQKPRTTPTNENSQYGTYTINICTNFRKISYQTPYSRHRWWCDALAAAKSHSDIYHTYMRWQYNEWVLYDASYYKQRKPISKTNEYITYYYSLLRVL